MKVAQPILIKAYLALVAAEKHARNDTSQGSHERWYQLMDATIDFKVYVMSQLPTNAAPVELEVAP